MSVSPQFCHVCIANKEVFNIPFSGPTRSASRLTLLHQRPFMVHFLPFCARCRLHNTSIKVGQSASVDPPHHVYDSSQRTFSTSPFVNSKILFAKILQKFWLSTAIYHNVTVQGQLGTRSATLSVQTLNLI